LCSVEHDRTWAHRALRDRPGRVGTLPYPKYRMAVTRPTEGAAITRLADAPADDGLVIREIWLLRLHALLARTHRDETPTATIGIATARWPQSLASRGIWRWPRR
jgi:hypothetical protein